MSDTPRLPFKLLAPGTNRLLVSVPHAGRRYDWLGAGSQAPKAGLSVLRRGEDPYVETLALPLARSGLPTLVQRAPRALIDVNRAPWEMAASEILGTAAQRPPLVDSPKARQGLGLVPTRLGSDRLYDGPLASADIARRLALYHAPYHATLAAMIADCRQAHDQVILLDLHSMPRLRPQPFASPHFVLGNRNGTSCPAWLMDLAAAAIRAQGYNVVCNQPYAGGYVVARHGIPLDGRFALQIEICRSLYLSPQAQRNLTGSRPSQGQRARSLSLRGCRALHHVLLELAQRLNAELLARASRRKAAE